MQAHLRTREELHRLSSALASARSTEETPDDPRVVEIGDAVDIRLEDDSDARYVIVHAIEASVDDDRISLELVEVTSPSGTYRCLVMSASRRRD